MNWINTSNRFWIWLNITLASALYYMTHNDARSIEGGWGEREKVIHFWTYASAYEGISARGWMSGVLELCEEGIIAGPIRRRRGRRIRRNASRGAAPSVAWRLLWGREKKLFPHSFSEEKKILFSFWERKTVGGFLCLWKGGRNIFKRVLQVRGRSSSSWNIASTFRERALALLNKQCGCIRMMPEPITEALRNDWEISRRAPEACRNEWYNSGGCELKISQQERGGVNSKRWLFICIGP